MELAPNEDFYYLWLGRALLEKARTASPASTSLLNEQSQLEGILKMDIRQTAMLGRQDLLFAARAVLLRARDINPLNTDHSANLARLYRSWADIQADPAQKAKYLDQSSKYYTGATRLSPHNAILWNEWALVELAQGNLDGAQQKLAESLKLDDRFDQTFMLLGQLYTSQQDSSKAIEAFQKAIEVQPKFQDAYLALGETFLKQNDLDSAAKVYQQALVQMPNSVQVQSLLAYVYAQQGKIPEAIQANLNLVKLAPNDPSVWNTHKNLAILYQQIGDMQAAINEARLAASQAPTAPTDYRAQLNDYVAQLRAQLAPPPPQPSMTTTVPVTK
jgi:tetratricopeptide (TPR) repeat protein